MTSIMYTPSREELEKIAIENPDFYLQIKQEILSQTSSKVHKYVETKLSQSLQKVSDTIYKEAEKTLFKYNSYGNIIGFSAQKDTEIKEKAEKLLNEKVEEELTKYLESEEFMNNLKKALHEKATLMIVKELEEQIKEEVKKLTI